MLNVENTGYEGKFDFPYQERPQLTYLLASIPRTGSSYLSHVLWRTGCLGAPLEYLNFDPAGPYHFARSAEMQQQLWRSVVRRRTSPNGVFGFKCFPMQLQALSEENPELLSSVMSALTAQPRPTPVVRLLRRDRLAHAISYARAALSGVWRKEQEAPDAQVDYSPNAVRNAQRFIDMQEAAWTDMFRDMRIQPLVLWYEDVAARPDEAIAQVAQYLGVKVDPQAAVAIPPVQKQAEADSRSWAERFAREDGN